MKCVGYTRVHVLDIALAHLEHFVSATERYYTIHVYFSRTSECTNSEMKNCSRYDGYNAAYDKMIMKNALLYSPIKFRQKSFMYC